MFSSGSGKLLFSFGRPNRILLIQLVRYYDVIVAGVVSFFLLLTTFQYAPWWTCISLIIYWIYVIAKLIYIPSDMKDSFHLIHYNHVYRWFFLTVGTTVFIGYIYFSTNYLSQNGDRDLLWLLFILCNFTLSQYGRSNQLAASLVVSSVIFSSLQFMTYQGDNFVFLQQLLQKLIWLWLISLILHILIKLISDSLATMELVQKLSNELKANLKAKDQDVFLQKVVDEISKSFGYRHVNMFVEVSPGNLKCVNATSEDGRKLVDSNFILTKQELSIIQHVYYEMTDTNPVYLSLDVHKDGYYLQPKDIFSNTHTELAVKITVGGRSYGVLDIQVDQKYAMFNHDKAIFIAVAKLIGNELETHFAINTTLQERNLVELLATKLLSLPDLREILIETAETAFNISGADHCFLYFRDPISGNVQLAQSLFKVKDPSILQAAESVSSQIEKFMEDTNISHWSSNRNEIANSITFAGDETIDKDFIQLTVTKSGIRHISAFKFNGEESCVGVIVLIFCRQLRENYEDINPFLQNSFVRMIAAVIERIQNDERKSQWERERLEILLHDNLISHLHLADQLLLTSTKAETKDESEQFIIKAQGQLNQAMTTLQFLGKSFEIGDGLDIQESVNNITDILDSFGVKSNVQCDLGGTILPPRISYEAGSIILEAAVNAIRHSSLTEFKISCNLKMGRLTLRLEDNGGGKQSVELMNSDDYSIKKRVQSINGQCKVTANNEGGITIEAILPINTGLPYEQNYSP